MLSSLRCDQRPGDLAGGNGVHRTTVGRWVREAVGLLAAVRAPVEHRFARLKNWRVLDKVRTNPRWATALVRPCWC
ncbi:hypothetical protein ACIBK8_25235 [Streptomyces sp. NPDC050161]|uniref:hypothetical protein n=1 Tax=Streptomyces sp. NPDC050161 TaxID=3365604 RepID=UPI0037A05271